ncbi:hypothetical protein BU24DRAFT_482590 [Aaosphaeria arxii CBS 175.79]|uniref:Uncharacterized protein n=1 Tax=Aaosphaeria arxii CBS 175.79 TaxID=1450172 RepID=A0A6A5XPA5_9PLEO|nr:uncharacterized protein BU24DRAFT_482590 [Aaosphaeria arxii CBS 175.79]KAF2015078.1 hypothetical protein BU24DRAFT_482590 [Aaosphaeria arxii CBS 175.79]
METSNPHQDGQDEQSKPQAQLRPHLRDGSIEELSSRSPRTDKAESSGPNVASNQDLVLRKGWPNRPRTIKSSLLSSISSAIFDIFLVASSTAFLALALIVKKNDKAYIMDLKKLEQKQMPKMILGAIKYGPTLFPILFASVLGRMTHTILCWRLVKGERMGVLDTLAASTSFTSIITAQAQMGRLNYFGVLLVAVWALSPLGGQATLRLMSIGPRKTSTSETISYMVPTGSLQGYEMTNGPLVMEKVNLLFMSTLIESSIRFSSRSHSGPWEDPYQNTRIIKAPFFGTRNSSNIDEDNWYNSTGSSQSSSYYSLIGIPRKKTELIHNERSYDLSRIHSSYWDLNCSTSSPTANNSSINNAKVSDIVEIRGTGATIRYSNSSLTERIGVVPENLRPFKFFYSPAYNISSGQNTLSCEVRSAYIESDIKCNIFTCETIRAQPSQLDHHPLAWTLLDLRPGYWPFFLNSFIGSIRGKENEPSLIDHYIANPEFASAGTSMTGANSISPEEYSVRLGQLLNTYFYFLNGMSTLPLSQPNPMEEFEDGTYIDNNQSFIPISEPASPQDNFGRNGPAIRLWETERILEAEVDSIAAHQGWISILATISSLLILASLITPIIQTFFLHGPDVMMNISSLASNDTHLKLPVNGSHLNAAERAKLLQDVKVNFGDVEPEKEVGRLAIGSIQGVVEIICSKGIITTILKVKVEYLRVISYLLEASKVDLSKSAIAIRNLATFL